MANETLTASNAANRDVPDCPPGPFQDCSDVVHISLFFDGTGNNKDADEATRKWSNVARMWRSAQLLADDLKARHAIYISGVGTKFNGEAANWFDRGLIWLEDGKPGEGLGTGGDRRLELGSDNVNARLRQTLVNNAVRFGGEVAAYAKDNEAKSFAELNKKLGQHRLIKVINISVFGFSRGAALARAFVNRLVGQCKRHGTELTYEGYPLRVVMLGLFDTVASFGLPAQNVRLPWDERELIVPHDVERCSHYVAAHELRFAFPVDLISQGGKLKGDWIEVLYPGVHSDVGGGYEPVSQGVSNNYSRIPMRDMMGDAVFHGTRLLNVAQVRQVNFPLYQERFEFLPATEAAYRQYMSTVPNGGNLRSQRLAHMRQLYSAYGTLHRQQVQTATQRQRDASFVKRVLGPLQMAQEVEWHRQLQTDERLRNSDVGNQMAQYVKVQDWQLAAWNTQASAGVTGFIHGFVHDSKVDFIGNVEPFSYFRLRTMQESTRSVWNETGDWISDKATQAGTAANEAAQAAERKAQQAKDWSAKKAAEAKDAAVRTYDAGKAKADDAARWADDKAQQAKDAAVQTYEAGKEKATEAGDWALRQGRRAEAGGRQVIRDGRRMVENGVEWVEQQADDAARAAAEAKRRVQKALGL